jgi:hypothetical protein
MPKKRWSVGSDGEPRTASGLRLLPSDMLKVGQIALDAASRP